jgi:hypothetical protein
MALAKFFNKTALAASHVLRGFDQDAFETALNAINVNVFYDKSAESSAEGRWTLELAVNLLARLYPKLSITSSHRSRLLRELINSAKVINPDITISKRQSDSLTLVVGATAPQTSSRTVFIGSDGWICKVSSDRPLKSGNTSVPFGADAAACIGVANLFRATFAGQLEDGRCDEDWQVSLLDLQPKNQSPANPTLGEVNLDEIHLVGIGAIGNACVWSLSRLRKMHGKLHLIDHQTLEPSNLQRYVLATDPDLGALKVDMAAKALVPTGLRAEPHPHRWGEYLSMRNDWRLHRVAVALDSANDRRAVQSSLPEWIVNAWTQTGDLGISRHSFVGDQACLACLYLPTGAQKNEDELVAEAIGLPNEKQTIRRLLVTNEPLTRVFLMKISSATGIAVEKLMSFEGHPLRSFYAQAVCGGILLGLGANPSTQKRVEVPMAFQSAFAGVLLAAELVANAAGLKDCPPPVTTKFDLLRPLGTYLSMPAPKHNGGNCICQDEDYLRVYREKYNPQVQKPLATLALKTLADSQK